MTNSLDERVAEGLKHLDANHPDWYGEIDLDELEMQREDRCILGQLDTGFWSYLHNNFHGLLWAFDHGFTLSEAEFDRLGNKGYEDLGSLWVTGVLIRRGADNPAGA